MEQQTLSDPVLPYCHLPSKKLGVPILVAFSFIFDICAIRQTQHVVPKAPHESDKKRKANALSWRGSQCETLSRRR